jgi:homoserine O-acetyltransferase/O-succinyltransferase
MVRALTALVLLAVTAMSAVAQDRLDRRDGDVVIKDFRFASGEVLPDLRLHYLTLGTPRRNAGGDIVNAILLLHGTSGTSSNWLQPTLADELFGPGQPLDASQYYLVIPDGIGRGGSSKPSNGLRMKFPHYRYADMVVATHRLVTEHLGIKHLRLVMGTSMGGMQSWMWGEMYPDFMDALVPVASQPIAISGRNWMYRRIGIEAIRNDPDWKNGDYDKNPTHYVYSSPISALMTESPAYFQEMAPSREAMDRLYARLVENARKTDANDQLYAIEAVMDYDPSQDLEKIKARLLAINFADDEVNPPELGVVEPAIKRIAGAQFVLIPATPHTHGHYTYNLGAFWVHHLADFMKQLPPPL